MEWLDAAGSAETAAEWAATQTELIRGGFGWAGVSVRQAASDGLKAWDPERYTDLRHPGDDHAYDMFSQAGAAVREIAGEMGPDVRLIAAGMSAAAQRISAYVDDIDRSAGIFDGFLVHCPPASARFGNNTRVPTLVLQTETEIASSGYGSTARPDAECFRLWEIAGAARIDAYAQAMAGLHPVERKPSEVIAALASGAKHAGLDQFVISAPQHHYLANAALHQLNRCVRDGVALPRGERLATVPSAPHILKRDAHGNAVGGVRTPWMDVPTALLTGVDPESAGLAAPFPPAMLTALYPSVEAYQKAFDDATEAAVAAGFLLRADAAEIKELAAITFVMSLRN